MQVPIVADSELDVGEALRVAETSGPYDWDVARDGERVLGAHLEDQSDGQSNGGATYPITVMVNWSAMLTD